ADRARRRRAPARHRDRPRRADGDQPRAARGARRRGADLSLRVRAPRRRTAAHPRPVDRYARGGQQRAAVLMARRPARAPRPAAPRELDGLPVALTDHSATSINLLRVLCERHYAIAPEWRTMPQDLDTMLGCCAGALLIGDRALVEGVLRRHVGRRGLPYLFD